MNLTDFTPHGMVVALGGIVAYVFRDHVKRDDERFASIKDDLESIVARQEKHTATTAANHAEILKLLVQAGQQAQMNAAIVQRDRPQS